MKQPLIVKLIPIHMHLTNVVEICVWLEPITLKAFVTLNLSINLCLKFATWKNHEVNKKISMKMAQFAEIFQNGHIDIKYGKKKVLLQVISETIHTSFA